MARLGAGCHVPAAAYAVVGRHGLWLRALIADREGQRIFRGERRGRLDEAEAIGTAVAEDLLARGAGELLC
jgi:hydroxymethylbilane synthase